jgi:hypothetical protein
MGVERRHTVHCTGIGLGTRTLFCHLVKHNAFYHMLSIKYIVLLNSTGNFVFCVYFYVAAENR